MKQLKAINLDVTNEEEYKRMLSVAIACQEAYVEIPEEVMVYFSMEDCEESLIQKAAPLTPDFIKSVQYIAQSNPDVSYPNCIDIDTLGVIKGVSGIRIFIE